MALLFMESFDHWAAGDILEKWSNWHPMSFENVPTIAAAAGRHSSSCIRWSGGVSNYGRPISKNVVATGNTVVVGFAFNQSTGAFNNLDTNANFSTTSYNEGNWLLGIRQAGTCQIWMRINQTGTISVLRGTTASTVLATSTRTLPLAVFSYIELKVVIDPSAGSIQLRVDNEDWIPLTGSLNTRNTASSTWDEIVIGREHAGATTVWDFDDLYVLDGNGSAPLNTFLGDCRVDFRKPTAASADGAPHTGWTPSTGANYAAVDDAAPNDDSDYTSTTTVNAIDTFVTEDAPSPGGVIYGVQTCLSIKKMDAGVCNVQSIVRHSGADWPIGADIAPNTSYLYYLRLAPTIPDGGSTAWTESNFNAAEFGYKRTA